MGTLDNALKDADRAMLNPPHREPNSFTRKQLALMTDDMIDRLLANASLIGDAIYGELIHDKKNLALTCRQAFEFHGIISDLMTCRRTDLDEHIERLRALFAGNLKPMAEDMAREFLENEEED